MTTEIDPLTQQMQLERVRESTIAINECYENAIVRNENNKLPEEVFRSGFLGYFTGNPGPANRQHLAEWISIAGSPTSEVDVVDPANKVLFTVPAMMNTDSLIRTPGAGPSMGELMREYINQKNRTPHAGNNFARLNFGLKAQEITEKGNAALQTAEQKWSKIFQHYGIPDPVQQTPGAAKESTAVAATSDYDYD